MRFVLFVVVLLVLLVLPVLALSAPGSQPASQPASSAIIVWLKANWPYLVFVVLIPSLITALSPYPKAKGVVAFLQAVLDRFSGLTHPNSPGTLKLPFTRSRKPKE